MGYYVRDLKSSRVRYYSMRDDAKWYYHHYSQLQLAYRQLATQLGNKFNKQQEKLKASAAAAHQRSATRQTSQPVSSSQPTAPTASSSSSINFEQQRREVEQQQQVLQDRANQIEMVLASLAEQYMSEDAVLYVHDDEVNECPTCQTPFGATLRRHHCRECGGIYCYDHVYKRSAHAQLKMCDECAQSIDDRLLQLERVYGWKEEI